MIALRIVSRYVEVIVDPAITNSKERETEAIYLAREVEGQPSTYPLTEWEVVLDDGELVRVKVAEWRVEKE